jgi:hypothetical protein
LGGPEVTPLPPVSPPGTSPRRPTCRPHGTLTSTSEAPLLVSTLHLRGPSTTLRTRPATGRPYGALTFLAPRRPFGREGKGAGAGPKPGTAPGDRDGRGPPGAPQGPGRRGRGARGRGDRSGRRTARQLRRGHWSPGAPQAKGQSRGTGARYGQEIARPGLTCSMGCRAGQDAAPTGSKSAQWPERTVRRGSTATGERYSRRVGSVGGAAASRGPEGSKY